jgi:glycosyltransferase involved in cell wall biosynthesis
MPVPATVIVRAKNEARTIGATLQSLRAQTVRAEVIVIDSGSTDGTVKIARGLCDRLIEIPPERFTYGFALNLGAREASAPVHFALSAHCVARRADWIERTLAHYEWRDIAGTNGIQTFADGTPVTSPFFQTASHARQDPYWGFSNHASSWRGSAWANHPFDEEMDYAEDREWSWRVLETGWMIAYDPALWVDMSHAWRGGAHDIFERQRRGARALRSFAILPPYGLRELTNEWWCQPPDHRHSSLFHRLNPRRMAGLAGKYVGHRQPATSTWKDSNSPRTRAGR